MKSSTRRSTRRGPMLRIARGTTMMCAPPGRGLPAARVASLSAALVLGTFSLPAGLYFLRPTPAIAGCSTGAPDGNGVVTITCTGNLAGGASFVQYPTFTISGLIITFQSPPPTVLNVDPNAPLSGVGPFYLSSVGFDAPAGEPARYTCVNGQGGNTCSITQNATQCSLVTNDADQPAATCVPVPATSGGRGDRGPNVTVNYLQPGAAFNSLPTVFVTSSGGAINARSYGSNGSSGGDSFIGGGGDGGPGANGGQATVNLFGNVLTNAFSSPGLVAFSNAGRGGSGGDSDVGGSGGDGGVGGAGGTAIVYFGQGTITTQQAQSPGIFGFSQGGQGGNGGSGGFFGGGSGGGNDAGSGGDVVITTAAGTLITTYGQYSAGIAAQSLGGTGGGAGSGFTLFYGSGANGGTGGRGGTISIEAHGAIETHGANSHGILAQSIGGGGGNGSSIVSLVASGGSGSPGGTGGTVNITNTGTITTAGGGSAGILGQSIGGGGGNGGSGSGAFAAGGDGSGDTWGGNVTITNTGSILTRGGAPGDIGGRAAAIFAQSIGGGGGNGGSASGIFSGGGSGASGGYGGSVRVVNGGDLTTNANWQAGRLYANSPGIFAQSIGGGGGNGGGAASVGALAAIALGGTGGAGGAGGSVTVALDQTDSAYRIRTFGDQSQGVLAQSVGGGGGNGGYAIALAGGPISVSLGVAGAGGPGGAGGAVSVETRGTIETNGAGSAGIFAQSVGGGGGSGGYSASAAGGSFGGLSIGIGGGGGSGGGASSVAVSTNGSALAVDAGPLLGNEWSIVTRGARSEGILAQSVGGGGGTGGFAASLAVGGSAAISVAAGGSGGTGGGAGAVTVHNGQGSASSDNVNILTLGTQSSAILAQSIGGGGGNGGFAVSLAASIEVGSAAVGLGGRGGGGGAGANVVVSSNGDLMTLGVQSHAILAQSIGGGGGNGGFAASGAFTLGVFGGSVGVGGSGGNGNVSGRVTVDSTGGITTWGDQSAGILAQSIGGGGGNGGFAGSISLQLASGASAAVAVGGQGGQGGNTFVASNCDRSSAAAGCLQSVSVTSTGDIRTYGSSSAGISAQSIGGGGGNGGAAISAAASGSVGLGVAVGGGGNSGGNGGDITVLSTGSIMTGTSLGTGGNSEGILAQSIGGGGGNGGFAGSLSLGGTAALGVTVGGNGAGGGAGGYVNVTSIGDVTTYLANSNAIVAQSIGGGGGNGGFAVSGAVGNGSSIAVGVGGRGGGGGSARDVRLASTGDVATWGASSIGLLAQSIGGGGGNGGFAGSLSLSAGGGGALGVSVGGSGGSGNSAGAVTVTNAGNIVTGDASIAGSGNKSIGILAQSIGGGGGTGGFSLSFSASDVATASVAVGGSGGSGGSAGVVTVDNTGSITTNGAQANAIWAQSIGGGGGSGGFALSGALTAKDAAFGAAVSVGGSGGSGNVANNVLVESHTAALPGTSIVTRGADSSGIFAQSIGGGGGAGGFSGAIAVTSQGSSSAAVGVSLGGRGGSGAHAGNVVVTSADALISTRGDGSRGIYAQSIGGGGGDGGHSLVATYSGGLSSGPPGTRAAISASIGGSGGAGGNAGTVTVSSNGTITTTGSHADGISAQSIGGGGGSGGFSVSLSVGTGSSGNISAAVGGSGGAGGDGSTVTVNRDGGDLSTSGVSSRGILAQSIGGGGGNGGIAISGALGGADSKNIALSIGGSGGAGGIGGIVQVTAHGTLVTSGSDAAAIVAQSIGGGGGNGGLAASVGFGLGGEGTTANVGVSVGGAGGTGSFASLVSVINQASIATSGDGSQGIVAQSIGGGGGNGGAAMTFLLGKTSMTGRMLAANVSVGGAGGSGGLGGAVEVTSSGALIVTQGQDSEGILAQSIGGGGGSGGRANSFNLIFGATCPKDADAAAKAACTQRSKDAKSGNYSASVAVGGAGGSGNHGAAVTVVNHSQIVTLGAYSDGIAAQSIGGGGGKGGNGIIGLGGILPEEADIVIAGVKRIFIPGGFNQLKSWQVGVGGSGGASGDGGTVVVENDQTIITAADYSRGIFAQSIGGGGGSGGKGSAGLEGKIGIGGSGGSTGSGGHVTVTNAVTGTIETFGAFSTAILAQSIGGGGGAGGAGASLINIGGTGSAGGTGGLVEVDNAAMLTTRGIGAIGIVAQSIGGGGGIAQGGILPGLIVVGGNAGDGSTGGTVTVANSGQIVTFADEATAILAQSIGGGGGAANTTGTPLPGSLGSIPAITLGGVAVVGNGGTGGHGGGVTIDNSGGVITRGANAVSLMAQSIGAGGGSTGTAAGLVAMGGSGGSSGDGGTVRVTNSGAISTLGTMSMGILAQSIGGGGGSSASDRVGNGAACTPGEVITISDCVLPGQAPPSSPGGAYGLVSIGGAGGSAGSGGSVEVVNLAAGSIGTSGDRASAIVAQSIGGGGGLAGSANGAAEAVMGATGANGSGGTVVVRNAAQLVTAGQFAFGVQAQSIGAGGGSGAFDSRLTRLGGTGTSAGNGALVTVDNSGTITTGSAGTGTGFGAVGILAQSIGGGGGLGGAATAVDLKLGGATGNSAGVSLTNTAAIHTFGDSAHAIVAQSIGGGGGYLFGPSGIGSTIAVAAGAGSGNSGPVSIINSGAIGTSGANAFGIFAQSIGGGGGAAGAGPYTDLLGRYTGFAGSTGGSGAGGSVDIRQSGDIVTTGAGSVAIYAQSAGGASAGGTGGAGNVSIDVATGSIVGGTGFGASAVSVVGGAANTITFGTPTLVTTVDGVSGMTVSATSGNDALTNSGVLWGSVDLGAGANSLHNTATGVFNAGSIVSVGAGNLVLNDGVISPGRFLNVLTTNVTGNFSQTAGAKFGVDLDLQSFTADRINVTGTAQVLGTIPLNILNPGTAMPGTREVVLVRAAGGVTDHTGLKLEAQSSAVATYALTYPDANSIVLSYGINFSPPGLSPNQHAIGDAINRILTDRRSPAFTPIAAALFYAPDTTHLGAVYNSLSGEGAVAAQQNTFANATTFMSTVLGQLGSRGPDAANLTGGFASAVQSSSSTEFFAGPGSSMPPPSYLGAGNAGAGGAARDVAAADPNQGRLRTWVAGLGDFGALDASTTVGSARMDYRGGTLAAGMDFRVAPGVVIGAATAHGDSSFRVSARQTTGSTATHFGALYGGIYGGAGYLTGAVSYGYFENSVRRFAHLPGANPPTLFGVPVPAIPGISESLEASYVSQSLGGRIEAGWRNDFGSFAITPFATLQVNALRNEAYRERQTDGNASLIGLAYGDRTIFSLPTSVGVTFDSRLELGSGTILHPSLRVSWVHEWMTERSINPSFIAAPGYDFVVRGTPATADVARLDLGVRFDLAPGSTVTLSTSGDISKSGTSFVGGGEIRFRW